MKWNDCVLISSGVAMGLVFGIAVDGVPLPSVFLADSRLQWETLVTGFAAVFVAWLTIGKLHEQIRQTGEIADDQRQRRARAARALLPLALSEIGRYATDCISLLYALKPLFPGGGALDRTRIGQPLPIPSLPRLPENVLSLVKECIEFGDAAPAEAMTDLIRHFQVQNYRLSEDFSKLHLNDGVHLVLWANIEQAILDAADLYARAGALFMFSRGGASQSFDIDRDNIHNALFAAQCFDSLGEIGVLADRWRQGR